MHRPLLIAAPLLLLLPGCVAKTVIGVATAPVRVAGKAADLATTSQSEADEKRGRDLRRSEQRLGKLERRYADELERCRQGRTDQCNRAGQTHAEIEDLRLRLPRGASGH